MDAPEAVSFGPAWRRSRSAPALTRVERSVIACVSLVVYRICRVEDVPLRPITAGADVALPLIGLRRLLSAAV
jgi:hypothetical protein